MLLDKIRKMCFFSFFSSRAVKSLDMLQCAGMLQCWMFLYSVCADDRGWARGGDGGDGETGAGDSPNSACQLPEPLSFSLRTPQLQLQLQQPL